MDILITICARGGSKGILGKNIKPLAGRPLIAYTISTAKSIAQSYNAIVSISSDSSEILGVAKQFGLRTEYIRPHYLATDASGKIEVIKDLLIYEENRLGRTFEYVLDLDVTSPLRTVQDVANAFELFEDRDALTLFSVNKAARNPYFNMVEEKSNGYFGLIKTKIDGSILSRQVAPAVYDLNASFYWYRRPFFSSGLTSVITEKSLIYEMDHLCFDLDHPYDFEFMEYLITSGKIDFELG